MNFPWQRPPTRDCYLRNFRSHVAYARATPTFPPRQASILHAYFCTGRQTGTLPQATRGALIDYWEAPRRLVEMFPPSGAVARILRAGDRMPRRRETPWRDTESQYFPEYDGYKRLVCEASVYAAWYSVTHRERGKRRKPTYRRGAEEANGTSYDLRADSELNKKAIDVVRRMLLVPNSRYYLARALVANDIFRTQERYRMDSPREDSPIPRDQYLSGFTDSISSSARDSASTTSGTSAGSECSDSEPHVARTFPQSALQSARLSIGTGCAESFFREI